MRLSARLHPIAAGVLLTACATGPSVMVLPGTGKSFEQFRADDAVCRQWAAGQIGTTLGQGSTESAKSGAAIGAAGGAAVGTADGTPATQGAEAGVLGGTAVGASAAGGASLDVQDRYDMTYMQCMYARGNQIPIPGGLSYTGPPVATPPAPDAPANIPPPPVGTPPPPPPGGPR